MRQAGGVAPIYCDITSATLEMPKNGKLWPRRPIYAVSNIQEMSLTPQEGSVVKQSREGFEQWCRRLGLSDQAKAVITPIRTLPPCQPCAKFCWQRERNISLPQNGMRDPI